MPEPEKTGYENLSDEDLIKHYMVNKHDYLEGCNLNHVNKNQATTTYKAEDFHHSTHGRNSKLERNALEVLLHKSEPSKANENIKNNLRLIHEELEKRKKRHETDFEESQKHANNIARQQFYWNLNPFNFIRGIVAGAVEILGILTKPIYIGKPIEKMSKYLVKDAPALQKVNGRTAEQDYNNKTNKNDMFDSVTKDARVIQKHLDSKIPEPSVYLKADLELLSKFKEKSTEVFMKNRENHNNDIKKMRQDIAPKSQSLSQ